MYDIAIIGAGPAGANLARLVGNKYDVLLMDRRDLDSDSPRRQKCCGGLLSPDAQKMMARLGLGIPKDLLVDPQLFAVRTIDLASHLERFYQRYYFNMDREKFDRWMVSLVPDSVERHFLSSFKGYREIPGGYEISCLHQGEEQTVRARLIVGADGAMSKVRQALGYDRCAPEKYIAIQAWYAAAHPLPYYTAIFDEEVTDFYAWIIPKEQYLLLGAALRPRERTWEKYRLLKEKLADLGFCFDKKIKTEGAFINRPERLAQFYPGQRGVTLIGEAAGAISPSSAEGISYALKTSLYLAQSLEGGLAGYFERYEKAVRGISLNLLSKKIKSPAMYQPKVRRLAMQSGLMRLKTIETRPQAVPRPGGCTTPGGR